MICHEILSVFSLRQWHRGDYLSGAKTAQCVRGVFSHSVPFKFGYFSSFVPHLKNTSKLRVSVGRNKSCSASRGNAKCTLHVCILWFIPKLPLNGMPLVLLGQMIPAEAGGKGVIISGCFRSCEAPFAFSSFWSFMAHLKNFSKYTSYLKYLWESWSVLNLGYWLQGKYLSGVFSQLWSPLLS